MAHQPWLQLLRPANVATALADVLAGYAVAGAPPSVRLVWLLGATASLYASGIVLNDVFDRHLDARERPERPIPSGRVTVAAAASAGAGLLGLGLALGVMAGRATGLVALAIAVAVLAYDGGTKRLPLVGPLNMGLCRALNLLLGMAAVPAVLGTAWPLALLPLSYIAAVTQVSRGEVSGSARVPVVAALATVAAVVVTIAALGVGPSPSGLLTLAIVTVLAVRVLPPFWRAARHPAPSQLRTAVRAGILSLVYLDAGIAAAYAGMLYVLAILVTGLVAGRLARLFAVT